VKRLLAFLLLLAAGGFALWLAIGDEAAVKADAATTTEPDRPRGPAGVPLQQGKIGIRVAQTGPLSFPQYKTVPLPDGTARYERVFVLDAEDSTPLNDTLQQLDRVTVLLFENDRETAKLHAQRAFLELSRDAAGKPTLREDKEIDLREVTFETLPGAKLEGLRLELGNARIQVGDDELRLRTASEDDPVLLVVDGQRSGTLRGRGLQARLPRNRGSALRRADIEILHDPVLETAGMVVRAKGRMVYREDMDRGAAIVTLDDEVQLDLTRGRLPVAGLGGSEPNGGGATSQVRGDRFTGWLRRDVGARIGGRGGETGWDKLQLTGAPASVELDAGRLLTPRITVLPGPFGDPWLVTAHGGESRIEQTRIPPGSKQSELVTGTSPRRIHLVRTGSGTGALLRSFGFPQWTLRPLNEQHVVVFEGASRLDGGNRTVTASQGLHAFHRERSDAATLRGFGDVRITQRATKAREHDLIATGNDGFVLHATETTQDLQLGPALPGDLADAAAAWQAHRYEVQYGAARATGVGACSFTRDGERTRLWLRAPGNEIAGRLTDQQLELDAVRQLEVVLDGQQLLSLEAAGLPARARSTGALEQVTAVAPRFVQIGPRSLRLEGVPPDAPAGLWPPLSEHHALPILTRTIDGGPGKPSGRVEVRGPVVDVHHLGGDDVLIDAVAVDGVRPTVNLSLRSKPDAEPTTAFFHAQRLRALPFVLTPEAWLAHAGGSRTPLTDLLHASTAQPWLLVDDVRDFQLEDPVHGLVEGSGTRLLLSQGAQAGLFVGDPDLGVPAVVRRTQGGRELTTRGARVRVFREQELRLQALRTFQDRPTFLLPSVTLHEAGSTGLLSHMNAVCQGNIDVLPDRVAFGGPVRVVALTADGEIDADGVLLDAHELLLRRDLETGRVVQALGKQVRLDWTRLQADAAEVELDLERTRCIARDPRNATVVMPGVGTVTSPFIEVNYETMAFRSAGGRMVRASEAGAPHR
jgi:hypothetical protein